MGMDTRCHHSFGFADSSRLPVPAAAFALIPNVVAPSANAPTGVRWLYSPVYIKSMTPMHRIPHKLFSIILILSLSWQSKKFRSRD